MTASDTVARFADGGISEVGLYVDNVALTLAGHAGSNTYEFALDTTKLDRGVHHVTAYAVDDFGNTSDCGVQLLC